MERGMEEGGTEKIKQQGEQNRGQYTAKKSCDDRQTEEGVSSKSL